MINPSAWDGAVAFTSRTKGGGEVFGSLLNKSADFAPLSQYAQTTMSPFDSSLVCKCGMRNIDNECLTSSRETMPWLAKTDTQSQYMSTLWAQPSFALTQTEALLALRDGPASR